MCPKKRNSQTHNWDLCEEVLDNMSTEIVCIRGKLGGEARLERKGRGLIPISNLTLAGEKVADDLVGRGWANRIDSEYIRLKRELSEIKNEFFQAFGKESPQLFDVLESFDRRGSPHIIFDVPLELDYDHRVALLACAFDKFKGSTIKPGRNLSQEQAQKLKNKTSATLVTRKTKRLGEAETKSVMAFEDYSSYRVDQSKIKSKDDWRKHYASNFQDLKGESGPMRALEILRNDAKKDCLNDCSAKDFWNSIKTKPAKVTGDTLNKWIKKL